MPINNKSFTILINLFLSDYTNILIDFNKIKISRQGKIYITELSNCLCNFTL